jgi:hypothetical protein
MIIAIIGVVAFIALAHSPSSGNAQSKSVVCSPQPCFDLQDYTIWVSNVTVTEGLVRMNVTFRNSSGSTHAEPSDLQLLMPARIYRRPPRTRRGARAGRARTSAMSKVGPTNHLLPARLYSLTPDAPLDARHGILLLRRRHHAGLTERA